jgi:hypothetical protein
LALFIVASINSQSLQIHEQRTGNAIEPEHGRRAQPCHGYSHRTAIHRNYAALAAQTSALGGLQKTGVTGEVEPGLSVRYMGTKENSIASHLVTRYFSASVLTTDAIARLDNVEVNNYDG